jgi:hypothetical protein
MTRLSPTENENGKTRRKRGREMGGSERHYDWYNGKEYIIGFEGSQALPVCPSGFHLTGIIEVQFYSLRERGPM